MLWRLAVDVAVALAVGAALRAPGSSRKPGRVRLRRLSRRGYANTVRDLIGVNVDVAALLPSEINARLKHIRFHATAGRHRIGVTFLKRSSIGARSASAPIRPRRSRTGGENLRR